MSSGRAFGSMAFIRSKAIAHCLDLIEAELAQPGVKSVPLGRVSIRGDYRDYNACLEGMGELRQYRVEALHRVERRFDVVVSCDSAHHIGRSGRTVFLNFGRLDNGYEVANALLLLATMVHVHDRLRRLKPKQQTDAEIWHLARAVAAATVKRFFLTLATRRNVDLARARHSIDTWIKGFTNP